MTGHMRGLHMLTFTLVIIGGLNWLLFGVFNWEIGQVLGGMDSAVSKIVYILVGLSAVYEIFTHGKRCRECRPDTGMSQGQAV